MELMTISEISRSFQISTRTLRYYEEIGLIQSIKKDDYAYRTYDEATITQLQQILVLRKLRIPLKQIGLILQSENTAEIIEAFRQNLNEVNDEITALSTIRDIIGTFIERLNESIHQDIKLSLLDDTALLEAVDALTVSKSAPKEEKTAADLQAANEKLNKLSDRNVRIIYVPPATVAAAHYIGDEPEHHASDMLYKFIKKSKLQKIHPSARCYGFNHPNPGLRDDGKYGYELWVTIPDDMEVPAPLEKKHFEGGLYAAYMILMDEIAGIGWTRMWDEWLTGNEHWEGNLAPSQENMNGLLEESLNHFDWNKKDNYLQQMDLLMPIKRKK
ncbi:MAG: effector binding domain-containing protein [Oscillospiraceae bacterium]|nr:effector binding domain-containing protein [Oscillospiraceae bacterium]